MFRQLARSAALVQLASVVLALSACSPSPAEIAEERRQEQQAQAQTQIKAQADHAWADVEDAKGDWPPEGEDYHAYNAKITSAYHRWEGLQLAAYGSDWRTKWRDSHRGDDSDCSADQNLGMPMSACEDAAASEGDIQPLEPLLFKCRSGGDVIPTDAESCRTQGKRTIADTAEGRAAAEATWETPEAQKVLADTDALDAQHEQQREHKAAKALKALGADGVAVVVVAPN